MYIVIGSINVTCGSLMEGAPSIEDFGGTSDLDCSINITMPDSERSTFSGSVLLRLKSTHEPKPSPFDLSQIIHLLHLYTLTILFVRVRLPICFFKASI